MNKKTKQLFLKPMLKIEKMTEHLKNKNIKFKIINENEATIFLKENNNYYNVTSYKNNFIKYQCGNLKGKYIDLEFAYLKDLSIIDYRTRLLLFNMIIDIEHYLKIRIINTIEKIEEENGYKIVNLYLEQDYNNEDYPQKIHESIRKKLVMNTIEIYFRNTILQNKK